MLPKRVIPCLDVEGGRVVKGTEFLDIHDVGDPVELARYYETEGADELVFLDITATSGNRAPMVELVRRTAAEVFIPLTVGGGVRAETDVQALLDAGADKVAVNSAALKDPALLDRASARFGKQCTVLAIDAKRDGDNGWEVYAAGGRIATGRQAVAWAQEGARLGAGEVLLTSIDRDGTNTGYDLELTQALTEVLDIPVIASGGAGQLEHYGQAIQAAGAEAVLAASQFHSGRISVNEVKEYLGTIGVAVRPLAPTALLPEEPDKDRPRIAIVDYGMGNRYSVQKALERVGADSFLTGEAEELAGASGLVLPGVGAFQPAIERLRETGLDQVIRHLAGLGKPILGICLGEQLLFDGSEEAGWCPGLGLLRGTVQEIESPIRPNIGWREVSFGQSELDYFYHLHQYAAMPTDKSTTLAYSRLPYLGNPDYRISTAVRRENIYGTQFHPEKSGSSGLRLLKNFVDICPAGQTSLQ